MISNRETGGLQRMRVLMTDLWGLAVRNSLLLTDGCRSAPVPAGATRRAGRYAERPAQASMPVG